MNSASAVPRETDPFFLLDQETIAEPMLITELGSLLPILNTLYSKRARETKEQYSST